MPDTQNFSHVTYTGDGSTQIFNIPFEFIKRDFVYATIDGVDMDMTTVEWLTDSSIRFAEAPANDSVVVIYRDTDKSEPLVDFADGSVLSEKDLDEEVRQLLHIAQEVYDVPGRMQETIDKMNEQYEYVHNVAEEVAGDVRESAEAIKNEAISAVNQTKDTVIETVTEVKDTAISNVNTTKDTAISAINEAVESQINRATAEANRAEEAANRVEAVSDLGPATADKLGLVKPGDNMTVDADGKLNVNLPAPPDPYTLPKASADVLGGVKVGDGLEIDETGKLKAKAQEINIGPDMMKDEATNTISDKREVLYYETMPEGGLPTEGVKNNAVAFVAGRDFVLLDGQWREITKGLLNALPIGASFPFRGKQAPYGSLVEDGSELQIATYPALYAAIGTTYGGDGVTTFKLPNSIGKYIRGGLADEVGTEVEAGLPNIEGELNLAQSANIIGTTGPFSKKTTDSYVYGNNMSHSSNGGIIGFSAFSANPIYGNSDTVTPPSLVALPCIKAFDTIAETAEVTTENLAAELVALRAELGQAKAEAVVSTIIYPNGGSAASPANVTLNGRYEMENPYQGYFVHCEAQIQINNKWTTAPTIKYISGSSSAGIACGSVDNKIVMQIGRTYIAALPNDIWGNLVADSPDRLTSLPCRVIVTRLGKMPD